MASHTFTKEREGGKGWVPNRSVAFVVGSFSWWNDKHHGGC